MPSQRFAALISGGKDSTYALHLVLSSGLDVSTLISIHSHNPDSYMYHTSNVHLTELFSKACGIPLVVEHSQGDKETELMDLKAALERADVDGVIAGAIASEYQKSRVEKLCNSLGLEFFAPLWGRDTNELMHEIASTLYVIFTHVAADGFDSDWLGRRLDKRALDDLRKLSERYRVHMSGEGGEYETLVLDAPFFSRKIEIKKARKVWRGGSGTFEVVEAGLVEK